MSVIIPKDGLPNREALQEFLKQHEYSSTSAYKAEQAREEVGVSLLRPGSLWRQNLLLLRGR